MVKLSKMFVLLIWCFTCIQIGAQNNHDRGNSFGLSGGMTFLGPMGKMSKFLESNGFGISSDGFLFGPINYPVKTGPRGNFSLAYSFDAWNNKEIEFEFNLVQLGEIAGLNNSGDRLEIGFNSYTLGANYRFGSRLAKLSIGPTLMLNRTYVINFENFDESKQSIDTKLSVGLKAKALIYFWNGKKSYGNIGVAYLFTYSNEYGPFPIDGNSGADDTLPETRLNFGHGSAFFSFGVKF